MKITKRWLQSKSACTDGIKWVVENCKNGEGLDVIKALMNHRLDWANWLIVRVMDRPQYLAYAIYAAEQVIDIYEKKYPNNKDYRLAIEATKAVLLNDTLENRELARKAMADATYVATYATYATYSAVYVATDAAYSAVYVATDAASATYASYVAAYVAADAAAAAAAAASSAADARKTMQIKILNYGLSLLEKKEK